MQGVKIVQLVIMCSSITPYDLLDTISKPKLRTQVLHLQDLPSCYLMLNDNIGWKRCYIIHRKISGRANELPTQITFCLYRNYKSLASYASKQLLKTNLNHHQKAHFISLLFFAFSIGEEISFKRYSHKIACCQYMHKQIMASGTCRSTITLIVTRFNFQYKKKIKLQNPPGVAESTATAEPLSSCILVCVWISSLRFQAAFCSFFFFFFHASWSIAVTVQ